MDDLPLTFFKNTDVPAIVLLVLVTKKYGTECYDWQPELLRKELEEDGINLTDLQSDKLQAAILVLTTDQVESHWEVFEKCCHLFNNNLDDFEACCPLEAEEIAMALPEIEAIRNAEHESIQYSDDINAYTGIIFHEYGLCKAPKIFPSSLLPKVVNLCDSSEKDEALIELYEARKASILEYIERLQKMHS
jgi:hypothetical protein